MEEMDRHRELMAAAIGRDAEGQRALLAGDAHGAEAAFTAAAELYRLSWEAAPPRAYGRLVGMLKAAILSGEGEREADYVRAALAGEAPDSPAACYARGIAALVAGDDATAQQAAVGMWSGSKTFVRTAEPSLPSPTTMARPMRPR